MVAAGRSVLDKRHVALTSHFLRFASVGVINTLLGYAVIFFCMYALHMGEVASNVIGYGFGLITSYLLNRNFTFRSKAAALPEAIRFVVIFALAYLANLGVLLLLVRQLQWHAGLSQIAAGLVYFALSFLLSKYYVFGPSRPGKS